MFIPILFIMLKNWKQPKCPSADEWINKMWYIHTVGIDLENAMLSKRNQAQRVTYCIIPCI
jgi:hypothetical protein